MLDLPSVRGSESVGEGTTITFLDEFRIIVLTPKNTPVPEFTIFDTLVPRNSPVSSRRFRVPSRYRDWFPILHIDDDRNFGTLDQDRPLVTDPAQAVLVVKLLGPGGRRAPLVVRVQTLIQHVDSTSTDVCAPWDEWGSGAAVIEVPERASAFGGPYLLVQGSRVTSVAMCTTTGVGGDIIRPHFCTFDLSRRGWGILSLRDEGDGAERRVAFEDGRNFLLQGDQGTTDWGFYSLGDGKFMHLVSGFHYRKVVGH